MAGGKRGFCAILTVVSGLLVCLSAQAGSSRSTGDTIDQIQDFEELDLEELLDSDVFSSMGSFAGVVVSASRREQDIGESPSAITVISREQIENTHCTDVVCLLRQVPEVQVMRIKPMFPAVGARALVDEAADKLLLLVDGQQVEFDIFSTVLWSALPVHLEDIERIEVIRGPGSAMYGANAHSMVVSIFTRKEEQGHGRVYLGLGEHGRSSIHGRVFQRLGGWQALLTGGMDTAGHWVTPGLREREVGRARFSLQRETESSVTVVHLGFTYGDGEIYSILGPTQVDQAMTASLFVAHVREHLQGKLSFNLTDAAIPLSTAEIWYGIFMLGTTPEDVPFLTTNLDLELQFDQSFFESNLFLAGANYHWGLVTSETIEPEEIQQHRVGVFLHDEQKLGEIVSLVGSLRLDYNSITPLTLSPRLALVFKPAADQFVRLAFGQAFRKPSYMNTSIHLKNVKPEPGFEGVERIFLEGIGNENLKNESITALEIGYFGRFLEKQLVLEADVFYQRYRDTITLHSDIAMDSLGLPDLRNSSIEFRNTGREVDSLGGSVSITWRLRRVLRINLNYTFRHSFYVSEASGINLVGEGGEGDRVSWEPAHLFNLGFHYLPERGFRLGAALYAASRHDAYGTSSGAFDPRMLIPQPAAWMASAFLAWRMQIGSNWFEAGIRALNVLQMPISDFPAAINPAGFGVGGEPITRRVVFFFRGNL